MTKIQRIVHTVTAATLIAISGSVFAADSDGDGIDDPQDNCTLVANPAQRDTDGDMFGNFCDPDIAQPNDLLVNFADLNVIKDVFFSTPASANWNPDADLDGSDSVNFADLNIVKAFFFGPPGPSGPASAPTYTNDVQPIFAEKCQPCHTGFGLGGHDIGINYADAFLPADNSDCDGLNVGQCTIVRILSGEMPNGAGCTGNPVQDAGNAACLTQEEQDTVQGWIDAGLPQ